MNLAQLHADDGIDAPHAFLDAWRSALKSLPASLFEGAKAAGWRNGLVAGGSPHLIVRMAVRVTPKGLSLKEFREALPQLDWNRVSAALLWLRGRGYLTMEGGKGHARYFATKKAVDALCTSKDR